MFFPFISSFFAQVSTSFLQSMFNILRLDNDATAREINRLNLENVFPLVASRALLNKEITHGK